MAVLIFIIILVVLIVGHEFGHFIVAKLSGMKVPEFGLGFPPKIWGKKIGDTEYTINALPFGGFVKIVGEDATEASSDPAAFSNRPKLLQAATLVAGPFSNILLAFVFSVCALMIGIPAVVGENENQAHLENPRVVVVELLPKSPAAEAGIKVGDRVVSVTASGEAHSVLAPADVGATIAQSSSAVTIAVERAGELVSFTVTPKTGLVPEEPDKKAIGLASSLIGTLRLPFFEAVSRAFTETVENVQKVVLGLAHLIASAATLSADVSNVAGPVGIASLAGNAFSFGFGSLLSFAAIISLNLGVLNLLPFPALDGGRLLFVAIEAVLRKPIHHKLAATLNFVGFAILILLMLAVTAHDIVKLVT